MKTGSAEHSLAMLRVSQLYYEQGLTQDQIASRLTLTRWKVGRLLDEARSHGVVTITINHPRARQHDVEQALAARYGLADVVVIPSDGSDQDVAPAVARAAAEYLCDLRPAPGVLGVSWGRTLGQVAEHIPPGWTRDVHVCQVNGAVSRSRRPSSGADAATEIARQGAGHVSLLSAPAILGSAATRRALVEDPTIADVLRAGREADTLLYSLGALSTDSVLVEAGYLDAGDVTRLRQLGAVGDVLGRFVDAEGREVDSELADRTVGLELADIRSARRALAVSSGHDKAAITRAVVTQGLCTVLITDSGIAKTLVEAA